MPWDVYCLGSVRWSHSQQSMGAPAGARSRSASYTAVAVGQPWGIRHGHTPAAGCQPRAWFETSAHLVQLAPRHHLERGAGGGVCHARQLGHHPFDARPVKAALGFGVAEVDGCRRGQHIAGGCENEREEGSTSSWGPAGARASSSRRVGDGLAWGAGRDPGSSGSKAAVHGTLASRSHPLSPSAVRPLLPGTPTRSPASWLLSSSTRSRQRCTSARARSAASSSPAAAAGSCPTASAAARHCSTAARSFASSCCSLEPSFCLEASALRCSASCFCKCLQRVSAALASASASVCSHGGLAAGWHVHQATGARIRQGKLMHCGTPGGAQKAAAVHPQPSVSSAHQAAPGTMPSANAGSPPAHSAHRPAAPACCGWTRRDRRRPLLPPAHSGRPAPPAQHCGHASR